MPASQKQSGGDDSTNLQAGNNITIYQGATFEETRQIALDVFDANFLRLTEAAADLAHARVEQFTRNLIDEMQHRAPAALTNVADPDMLRTIYRAQEEYACSGDSDLEQVLIDLLVDRAGQFARGLKTLALNEAIVAVARLTADQRSAIAICFLVRYTTFTVWDLDEFYDYLSTWLPILSELPMTEHAYSHIQYIGAASLNRFEMLELAMAFAQGDRRFFTRGFKADELAEPLRQYTDDPRLFRPCIRDSASLQTVCSTDIEFKALTPYLRSLTSNDELIQPYKAAMDLGIMTAREITDEVVERIPEFIRLFEVWNNTPLTGMSLTSVGIAIGHAYWRRTNTAIPDLTIWLDPSQSA